MERNDPKVTLKSLTRFAWVTGILAVAGLLGVVYALLFQPDPLLKLTIGVSCGIGSVVLGTFFVYARSLRQRSKET